MTVHNQLLGIELGSSCTRVSCAPRSEADECFTLSCSDSKLSECRDISSWTTLYFAGAIRNNKPITEASTESEFSENPIKHHCNCRAEFTSKRDVQVANN